MFEFTKLYQRKNIPFKGEPYEPFNVLYQYHKNHLCRFRSITTRRKLRLPLVLNRNGDFVYSKHTLLIKESKEQ